jgi:hypothetical protein
VPSALSDFFLFVANLSLQYFRKFPVFRVPHQSSHFAAAADPSFDRERRAPILISISGRN